MPSINVNVITLFIFRFRGTRRHPANLPGRVGLTPRWTKVQNVLPVVQVMSKTALILNSDAKVQSTYVSIVRRFLKSYYIFFLHHFYQSSGTYSPSMMASSSLS